MKLVSIILPVYNGEKYIEQAVQSIIGQSYQNWELIIVNDCSTDRTEEILNKYQEIDSRIYVVKNEENLKLPCSLNVGFQIARGDYLTWTSDDNIALPNYLQELSTYLDNNTAIDFVYSDYIGINEEGKDLEVRKMLEPENMIYKNSVGASFMYRRKIFDEIGGYSPEWFLVEDYEYWMRVYKQYNMKHISKVLYKYRFHNQSLSKTRLDNIIEQTYKMKLFYLEYISDKLVNVEKKYLYYDDIVEHCGKDVIMKILQIDNLYMQHFQIIQKQQEILNKFPKCMNKFLNKIVGKYSDYKVWRAQKDER